MSVPHIAGIELMVYAMREAQSILAQHIERSPRDAEETISLLLEILDRQDVVAATDRLCPRIWIEADKIKLGGNHNVV